MYFQSILLYSFCVAIYIVYQMPSSTESAGLGLSQQIACQAINYQQYLNALQQYPKAQVLVNKFFFNGTCQTQCLIKSGAKTVQTLNPIQTPNYVLCGGGGNGGNKFNKQKMVCFDGVCSTVAQIAAILGTTTTTVPTTTVAGGG